MNKNYSDNKKIAKNTILLYIRMLFLMLISLFTSRVVLQALGVEDYGIYNVVGGVVAMFSIISSALNAATVRFIAVELGKDDKSHLREVFSTTLTTQLIIIAFITFLLETVGLWFVNYKMVIPTCRLIQANWVFQLSVVTFALNLWSIPYNALIIAHERMSAFAYVSIFEGVAKLCVAYIILSCTEDKLVVYAILLCLVSIVVRVVYGLYCRHNFEECVFNFRIDIKLMKDMFKFAGWNFIGSSATIIREQGSNILLNIFFGPAINAAKGLALTVNAAVTGFTGNFMAAVNPQIYKSFSSKNIDYCMFLVFQSTRFSYFIFIIFGLPVICSAPYLLQLWLGSVPDYTINFVRLVLIFSLSESLAGPLLTLTYATGRIKSYQLCVGVLQLLNIPVMYIFLYYSFPPEITYLVSIVISIVSHAVRLTILHKSIGLNIRIFCIEVYSHILLVSIFSFIVCWLVIKFLTISSFYDFLLQSVIVFVSEILIIYCLGLNCNDRNLIKKLVKSRLNGIF